ncbi:MAG: GNAT family N-acetyltransferase [Chloroflexi bacterium]|nr:GNAT family N-acetyltransferase [Chloroflexota bacterium]
MADVSIVCLSLEDIPHVRDTIVRIYGEAFSAAPYNRNDLHIDQFGWTLDQHARRAGFRLFVAREEADGAIVGFVYGHTGKRGQWWHDTVTGGMSRAMADRWLSDYMEFVELAVLPSEQGRGIGGLLHDAVLEGIPYRTAALSTIDVETNALHLYYKRGWVDLLRDFRFPGVADPYRIMGKELHTRPEPAREPRGWLDRLKGQRR